MTKNIADPKPTYPARPDAGRGQSTESERGIPDSTLELIARLDPTFSPTSAARRALAQDRPVSLGRHQRNCSICRHPDRDAIELAFLHWHSPEEIAAQFALPDWSSVYRHVRAFGLFAERRRNARFALESIIERVGEIQVVTPRSIVAAVRAFTRINNEGEWVEPPTQIIVTHVTVSEDSLAPLAPLAPSRGEGSPPKAGEVGSEDSLVPPAAEENPAAAPGPACPEKIEDPDSTAAIQSEEIEGKGAEVPPARLEKRSEELVATQNEPVSNLSNRKLSPQSRKINFLKTKEGS